MCISQLPNYGSSYGFYLRQKTSMPLFPWLWCLAQTYNFVHVTSQSNSTSCCHSSPGYETSITVNKARVQEVVQESHLVNCQLIIKFIQFLDNKRSTLFLRRLKSQPHTIVKICSPVFVYMLTLQVIRYPARDKSYNQKAPYGIPLDHVDGPSQ